ncbi:MAG: hypothetical protein ABII23_03460 [bacterium]
MKYMNKYFKRIIVLIIAVCMVASGMPDIRGHDSPHFLAPPGIGGSGSIVNTEAVYISGWSMISDTFEILSGIDQPCAKSKIAKELRMHGKEVNKHVMESALDELCWLRLLEKSNKKIRGKVIVQYKSKKIAKKEVEGIIDNFKSFYGASRISIVDRRTVFFRIQRIRFKTNSLTVEDLECPFEDVLPTPHMVKWSVLSMRREINDFFPALTSWYKEQPAHHRAASEDDRIAVLEMLTDPERIENHDPHKIARERGMDKKRVARLFQEHFFEVLPRYDEVGQSVRNFQSIKNRIMASSNKDRVYTTGEYAELMWVLYDFCRKQPAVFGRILKLYPIVCEYRDQDDDKLAERQQIIRDIGLGVLYDKLIDGHGRRKKRITQALREIALFPEIEEAWNEYRGIRKLGERWEGKGKDDVRAAYTRQVLQGMEDPIFDLIKKDYKYLPAVQLFGRKISQATISDDIRILVICRTAEEDSLLKACRAQGFTDKQVIRAVSAMRTHPLFILLLEKKTKGLPLKIEYPEIHKVTDKQLDEVRITDTAIQKITEKKRVPIRETMTSE